MPINDERASANGFENDRVAHTIRFVRQLAADPVRVFAAWTTPAELAQWWDAGGEPLAICEMDLRPGGSFRFAAPSHLHMPFAGTYVEIAEPERLVFKAMGATGRVILTKTGYGASMTVEIVCNSAEQLEQFIKMGVANGTASTCDNLETFLDSKR